MDKHSALVMLQQFVVEMGIAGIDTKQDFKLWAKDQEDILEELFDYERGADMPKVSTLVSPFFHKDLPLVGLNYSQVAHNVLYKCPQGWTTQLRMCRGIVFDRAGELVALPLHKFFNAGENPETKRLPGKPMETLEKMDGHLGIIFWFNGCFHLTTRGSFYSKTAVFAGEMLQEMVERNNWHEAEVDHLTIMPEVIHPDTQVICDYGGERNFTLIAVNDIRTLETLSHDEILKLGKKLGLRVVTRWPFTLTEQILDQIKDPGVKNREGYVVRYADGRTVKFKFQTYLAEMRARKLSYSYLMLRFMDGRIDEVMRMFPEEILPEAEKMLADLKKARRMRRNIKLRRKYLYDLVPPEQSTPYYRTVCRNFLRYKK
ncbi:MAG: T4 RnlA family RNA ligase [Patescibacteria group bacterium]|nr:T4 RnlA family RNA ligase [Patescibacteria group bacterium]